MHPTPRTKRAVRHNKLMSKFMIQKWDNAHPKTKRAPENTKYARIHETNTRSTSRKHLCHVHVNIHVQLADLYERTPHLKPNAQDKPKQGTDESGALATQRWNVGPHKKWRAVKPSQEQRGHRETTSEGTSRCRTATDKTTRKCCNNTHASQV